MELPISSSDKLMVKFGHEYAEEGENLIVIPEEEGEINVAWFMYCLLYTSNTFTMKSLILAQDER